MRKDQINQFLKQRRAKIQKAGKFRNKRIKSKFYKSKNDIDAPQNQTNQPQVQRKMQFYKQVFDGSTPQSTQPKKQKNKNEEIIQQIRKSEQKVHKLKDKKKKFIKKMSEKTKKGQPVMNNYVKYALTKLQETIQKEKLLKKKEKFGEKKETIGEKKGNFVEKGVFGEKKRK